MFFASCRNPIASLRAKTLGWHDHGRNVSVQKLYRKFLFRYNPYGISGGRQDSTCEEQLVSSTDLYSNDMENDVVEDTEQTTDPGHHQPLTSGDDIEANEVTETTN